VRHDHRWRRHPRAVLDSDVRQSKASTRDAETVRDSFKQVDRSDMAATDDLVNLGLLLAR
jgi:hypothetical protein